MHPPGELEADDGWGFLRAVRDQRLVMAVQRHVVRSPYEREPFGDFSDVSNLLRACVAITLQGKPKSWRTNQAIVLARCLVRIRSLLLPRFGHTEHRVVWKNTSDASKLRPSAAW
jgi:hypothetical protein